MPNSQPTIAKLQKEVAMLRECNEAAVRQEQINRNECNRLRLELGEHIIDLAEHIIALEESVRLQTHYAKLINMHDGGERRGFLDGAAWMDRLRETGKLPPKSGTAVPKG